MFDYDGYQGYSSNYWRLKNNLSGKMIAAKRLEKMINKEGYDKKRRELNEKLDNEKTISNKDILDYLIKVGEKHTIRHNDVEYKEENAIICFQDNKINEIRIGGKNFFFKGTNRIEKIISNSSPDNIYYGPYNELDKKGKYARHHKTLFITLKEYALKGKDKSQELILNRELMRCERHILNEERKSFKFINDRSRKDRLVLWFNKVSNDFGLNWFRSLLWALGFNLLFLIVLLSQFSSFSFTWSDFGNTIGMFFEFLLPTNSVKKVIELKSINKG